MKSSRKLEINSPNRDTNSKAGIGWEQHYWANMDVNSIDSSKPIPDLPTLSTSNKTIREIESDVNVKASIPGEISPTSKKHGKVCWWWRRGRCHHGNKCWFAHNNDANDPVRGSHGTISNIKKGKTQLHHVNLQSLSGRNRSPRERERNKGSDPFR